MKMEEDYKVEAVNSAADKSREIAHLERGGYISSTPEADELAAYERSAKVDGSRLETIAFGRWLNCSPSSGHASLLAHQLTGYVIYLSCVAGLAGFLFGCECWCWAALSISWL